MRLKVTTGSPQTYAKDLLTKGAIGNHRSGAMPIPQYVTDRLLSHSPFNVTHWRRPAFDASSQPREPIARSAVTRSG